MKRYLSKNKFKIIYSSAALILMWLTWIIVYAFVKNEYIIPSFWQTVKQLIALLGEGSFWLAFSSTLLRVFISFTVSFVLALICSFLGAVIKNFNAFFSPLISVLRTVPTMAVILIILIWTTPRTAPVIVTALVLFPMIYAQINAGLSQIDSGILQAAKVYNFSKKTMLTKVYIPLAGIYVFSQTGANLSFAIKLTVSAEVIAYTYVSLGGMLQEANGNLSVARLAALTIIAVLAGIAIEVAFHFINNALFKWSRTEELV